MEADERLKRAYSLCDGLLRVLRGAQASLSVNYERQPEPVGVILGRFFKRIEGRGKEGENHER